MRLDIKVQKEYQQVIRLNQIQGLDLSFRNILLQLFIAVRSVIFSITVCVVFTVTSTQAKFCAGQVVSPAWTSLGCAMGFALTSDQLYNGLWCRWNLCGGRYDLTMAILTITMFEWFQKTLPHHSGLAPHSTLNTHSFNVLLKGTNCRRQLDAFCQMFAKQMP